MRNMILIFVQSCHIAGNLNTKYKNRVCSVVHN